MDRKFNFYFIIKFVEPDDVYLWIVYLSENVEMIVLRDDKLGTGCDGTIYEFVVIGVRLDEVEVVVCVVEFCRWAADNSVNHHDRSLKSTDAFHDFSIFKQDFVGDTKSVKSFLECCPKYIILASGGEALDETIRIQNNIVHDIIV